MKKLSTLFLLVLFISQMYGQKIDSLAINKKLSYKNFIVPAAVLTGGIFLLNSSQNNSIQEKSNAFFGIGFNSKIDNFTPLVPVAQIYAGRYIGFQPKNTVLHQTVDIVIANSLTLAVVQITKNLVKEERPDASNNLSFPSGHTAIAFTNAALLFQEYKDSNFWYASSGFIFATTTGILRIANNKHYSSDVLAGAGIGLLSGIIVSNYNPFQSIKFGRKKSSSAFVYPQFGKTNGLGILIQPNF
ncbi:Membrane-associated phospholipid phosphatase [Flavobacterium gillisiae]|uniref:Membrane-associated phospholipid phosphatase n=1 Tax=Flavobacterium gillisiae TaxID=150146 RepID=A0A1H3WHY3_9FLAO|nr:phosphatase PAP2 family protein [Flavobacterium gillisiae]SDZ86725.1 Membrane-associated phospholipid phosphatase [Flavobacterium gillisiae]